MASEWLLDKLCIVVDTHSIHIQENLDQGICSNYLVLWGVPPNWIMKLLKFSLYRLVTATSNKDLTYSEKRSEFTR